MASKTAIHNCRMWLMRFGVIVSDSAIIKALDECHPGSSYYGPCAVACYATLTERHPNIPAISRVAMAAYMAAGMTAISSGNFKSGSDMHTIAYAELNRRHSESEVLNVTMRLMSHLTIAREMLNEAMSLRTAAHQRHRDAEAVGKVIANRILAKIR